jgi:hypothetical protein
MSITLTAHGRTVRIAEKDRQRITVIVSRAVDELVTLFLRGDLVDLMADLALCRRRYRLDLEKLSALGRDDFCREITNINHRIDRKTGKMPEGFTPRYLKKKETVKGGAHDSH